MRKFEKKLQKVSVLETKSFGSNIDTKIGPWFWSHTKQRCIGLERTDVKSTDGKFFSYVKTGFKVKRGQKKGENKEKELKFFFVYELLLGGTKFH